MLIGITVRFQNSFFSGAVPQVACSLARALAVEHTVELLYPPGDSNWFIDNKTYADRLPPRVEWSKSTKQYDIIIEVAWSLHKEDRKSRASRVIYFSHYSPIFHDMESCVYPCNPTVRNFENLSAIWTYDTYTKQDVEYFELLSGIPVAQIPYTWDPDALDDFAAEQNLPSWIESAKGTESALPKELPPSMSWCLRIFESNISNSSHCNIPLNIVSEIRKTVEPVRFTAHNAQQLLENDFMKQNVLRNLLVPDAEKCMLPRIRLPEVIREKSLLVAHQRWRPMKNTLLDATYLGIPMIHNNLALKTLGAPYWYDYNQIRDAVEMYKKLNADYKASTGFFESRASTVRKNLLRARFSPIAQSKAICAIVGKTPTFSRLLPTVANPRVKQELQTELRIAFATMWDDFVPEHNFFTYLLQWLGSKNNIKVTIDYENPNLVFWGPLSEGTEKRWPNAPKIYFTGENSRPVTAQNTFLNVGFDYIPEPNYVRLPLWILEINWFGGDVERMKNPRPVSIEAATTVPDLEKPRKFCAFVATNPNNPVRNATFDMINKWRPIDSGGRLFCNLPGGPIPAGRGGGGGELAKIDFYKNYKFVLAIENSSREGYCTEKMFHAKVAGCVPIYWGDRFADRDFDASGYIDINGAKDVNTVIDKISAVMNDDAKWKAMASIPALSGYKKAWCEHTMVYFAQKVFKHITGTTLAETSWKDSTQFVQTLPAKTDKGDKPTQLISAPTTSASPRIFVTAANMKYAESAINAVRSYRSVDATAKIYVYLWGDVTEQVQQLLRKNGANELRVFPTERVKPWADFWEPQHFAWKLWLLKTLLDELDEGTSVLYADSGVVFTRQPTEIWDQLEKHGILAINDPTQTNRRWCSPDFCRILEVTESELSATQLWAGCFGYRKGAYDSLAIEALRIADKHRDAIVGNKWTPYSSTCMGHRHDQSILSLLTMRRAAPRMNLNDVYCDTSFRAAQQFNVPLYVHRGQFKQFTPFKQGIDEMYLINLPRRKDRLESWKAHHPTLKDATYVLPAVDGRTLQLTPELIECFRNNDFKWKKSVMGCALSHLRLWEKLANDDQAKSYLIMEDDVRFDTQWLATWEKIASQMPYDADVIYLGGVLPPNKPALPEITESVNAYFARVKKNSLYGGPARRYFHFCNYSYILTKSGAQKIVQLVKERGIFTSGDHMIVNHGDSLLNIYFTTPLLATCFQENDPVYQRSEFNNFNRVDNFDSDLWNNTECFTEAEIAGTKGPALEEVRTVEVKESVSKGGKGDKGDKGDKIDLWNAFLVAVAQKNTTGFDRMLHTIFDDWDSMDLASLVKNFGWFRIFEQFIVNENPLLLEHSVLILERIQKLTGEKRKIFDEVEKKLTKYDGGRKPSVISHGLPPRDVQVIYHIPLVKTAFLEDDWLTTLYGKPVVWRSLKRLDELLGSPNPTLLYQQVPGKAVAAAEIYNAITKDIQASGVKVTLLHLSDEFAADDIALYAMYPKVVRNYVRKDLPPHVLTIPLGFTNGRHANGLPSAPSWSERELLWSFAGSLDRPGRDEAIEILKRAGPYVCETKEDWSAKAKLDGPAYNDLLRKSKFVPCFTGFSSLESYRLYEALEHGAIPIYVVEEGKTNEYETLFGKMPFLQFKSWEQATALLPQLASKTDVMEKQRAACEEWWKQIKKQYVL